MLPFFKSKANNTIYMLLTTTEMILQGGAKTLTVAFTKSNHHG